MRLVMTVVGMLIAVAISQVAIASAIAQGEAVVAIAAGEGETALEWDIEVAGGDASASHITLEPAAVGLQSQFTVAVAGSAATVTMTAVLPEGRGLSTVGCLDDRTPPTEINPVVDGSRFILDVVAGREYRCFVVSAPIAITDPAAAPAVTAKPRAERSVPRSDTSSTSITPGWPVVLITLVLMAGIALLLRPSRR
jgi:hypothetical protein